MSGDIRYIALPCWRKVIQKGKSGWFHLVSINLRFHWGVHLKILLFSNFSNKQASASKKTLSFKTRTSTNMAFSLFQEATHQPTNSCQVPRGWPAEFSSLKAIYGNLSALKVCRASRIKETICRKLNFKNIGNSLRQSNKFQQIKSGLSCEMPTEISH